MRARYALKKSDVGHLDSTRSAASPFGKVDKGTFANGHGSLVPVPRSPAFFSIIDSYVPYNASGNVLSPRKKRSTEFCAA